MTAIIILDISFQSHVALGQVTTPETEPAPGFDSIESGRELVNMDFPELTDIRDIIKAVSLWTGKNVILDRNVSGMVQIISPKPVTKVEAYEAFKSALNILNLTPVETGKFIKIMPIRSALKDNLRTYYGASYSPVTDQVITQVIPLKFIDAKTVRSMLSKVVSANSIIVYEPTNTLIVSESGFKINRILEIVKYLDVETEQSQVAIVPIVYSDAKSIASQVKQIFSPSSGAKKQNAYHSYKIFPDPKTNSVIIFGPPRTIKDVRDLVKKFDVKVEDSSSQASIHVRPLDYADAEKLAATLNALTGKAKTSSLSNRLSTIERLRGVTESSKKKNSPPSVAELENGVKITADKSSNSLLITGSRAAYNAVNAIVRKMDVKKSQVFIETDILDIGITRNINVESSVFAGYPSDIKNIAGWNGKQIAPLLLGAALGGGTKSLECLQQMAAPLANDFVFGVMAGTGVDVPGIGNITPAALIKLLKADSNTRVLSSPHILISNNETGIFASGNKIFLSTNTPNRDGVLVPSIEKEDVKLQLEIKPNISYSDYVTMQINLDADSLAEKDPQTGYPIISQRKTSQSVTVKNSQTIVISGLVSTTESESFKKIPLLGDIPLLGWLFRQSVVDKKRNNLVIFVTAYIVHGPNDLAKIYQRKLKERDTMLEVWSGLGRKLSDDPFYAALPTPEDGEYSPTEIDRIEERRLKELREQLYLDMGYKGGDQEPAFLMKEVYSSVPAPPNIGDDQEELNLDPENSDETMTNGNRDDQGVDVDGDQEPAAEDSLEQVPAE
ncbi:MAG: type II secretion system secretin GspD [Proteobacteria bacterium]|nr:type II secretion system secretin GspD [Pseudomonadota bacterium]